MAYEPWHDALARLVAHLDDQRGMWGGVAVRFLLRDGEGAASQWTAQYTFAQLIFEPVFNDELIVQIAEPRIVWGTLTISTWRALLRSWANGNAFEVEGYQLNPSEIEHVDDEWNKNVVSHWNPLIVPIQVLDHDIEPLGWITHGSGRDEMGLREKIYDAIRQYHFFNVETFAFEYLGRNLNDLSRPMFYVVWPWGAWLSADAGDSDIRAELRLRPPLRTEDFWMAWSSSNWSMQTERRPWPQPVSDGVWERSAISLQEESTQGGPLNIWAGCGDKPELHSSVDFRPITPERERERILIELYRRSLGGAGKRRIPFSSAIAPGLDQVVPSTDFELAVTNVYGALGYSVISTGVQMKMAGIDAIAFEAETGTAWVISATLGNDVAKKLQTLLMQREWVTSMLSQWTVRWAIVAGVRREDVVASAQNDCREESVLLICREELELLASEPPNYDAFLRFFKHQ